MASRKHGPAEGGVNWTLVLVPLVVAALALGGYVLLRDGENARRAPREPAPPFAFTRGNTQFVSVGGSTEELAPEDREGARAGVDALMSDLYDQGFVTRARWGGGRFPGFLDHFAPEAAEQAAADLGELTLGDDASRFRSVRPESGSLEVAFLLRKQDPIAAVAETAFRARGRAAGGGDVAIAHDGTFFIRLIGGQWRIVGYEVNGEIGGTPVPVPGPTATAEGA